MSRSAEIVRDLVSKVRESDAYDADVNPDVHRGLWDLMKAGKIKWTDDGYVNVATGNVLNGMYDDPMDADDIEKYLNGLGQKMLLAK
jgi:hypothetical protein